MSRSFRRFAAAAVLAAVLITAYAAPVYLYAKYAQNYHHNTAIDAPRFPLGWELERRVTSAYYPPLYHVWAAAGSAALNLHYAGTVLLSIPFVLIAAWYAYRLSSLRSSKAGGAAAALGVLLFPGTAMVLSATVRDVPLMAFSIGAAYHLFRSDGMRRPGHAAMAGLLCGLGLLTKWTFPIYVIGLYPVLFQGIARHRTAREYVDPATAREIHPAAGAAIGVAAGLAACGWWYFGVLDWSTLWTTTANDPTLPEYTYGAMLTYVTGLLGDQFRWFWWPPLIAGFAVGVVTARHRFTVLTGAACVAATVLLLSAFVHTEDRYLTPVLPFAALSLAPLVDVPRKRAVRFLAWIWIALTGVAGYADTFFGWHVFGPAPGYERLETRCDHYQHEGRLVWNPNRGTKDVVRIVESHVAEHYPGYGPVTFVIAANWPRCQLETHALTLSLDGLRARPPIVFVAWGTSSWDNDARYVMATGDPAYFIVEEEIKPVFDEEEPAPFIVDPATGEAVPKHTRDDRLAARAVVRENLPKIGEADVPPIGRVGIYLRAPGMGDPFGFE